VLDDLVERAGNGRQARQLLDQRGAAGDGLAAFDGLAVTHDRTGRDLAVAVGEGLVELNGEAGFEVGQDIFARRDVRPNIVPFLGRDVGQTPFRQRLAGRDDLDDGGMAVFEIAVIDRISVGVFMLVSRWPKNRCLADSKAERAADFACLFSVPVDPVMLAASIAASRLLWMMAKAPA
jgi:hypothetical protein